MGEYTNGTLVGGVLLRNSGEEREKSLKRWDKGGDCVAKDVGELVARFVGGVRSVGSRPSVPVEVRG